MAAAMAALSAGALTALVISDMPTETTPMHIAAASIDITENTVPITPQDKDSEPTQKATLEVRAVSDDDRIAKVPVIQGSDATDMPILAVVVDDCGYNMDLANRLADRGMKFTWAIIPNLKYSQAIARLLDSVGTPYLIHVPMQAHVDKDGLFGQSGQYIIGVGMDEMQVIEVLSSVIESMPGAIGINNHRGSKATDDRLLMSYVMDVLSKRGKIFLDSATSSRSTALKTAAESGIDAVKNDTFLDNVADRDVVMKRFIDAIACAKTKGSAVAICHLRPETVAFLETIDDSFFVSRGVRAVTLPELLKIRKEYTAK